MLKRVQDSRFKIQSYLFQIATTEHANKSQKCNMTLPPEYRDQSTHNTNEENHVNQGHIVTNNKARFRPLNFLCNYQKHTATY